MFKPFLSIIFIISILLSCKSKEDTPFSAKIQLFEPEAQTIVDSTTVVEELATGFSWAEGPVWVENLNALLFSDVPENKIYIWSQNEGLRVFLEPSGFTDSTSEIKGEGSNGLAIDAEGDLVLCQHGDRRLAILKSGFQNPVSDFITLTDNYNENKFNSPNDLAIKKNGDIYFTDPPYGLKDESKREIKFNGVYLLKSNGEVSLLIDSLTKPNGIALSPDESTLYIANSDPAKAYLYCFKLDSLGNLIEPKIFFDTNPYTKDNVGLPDGLKVHSSGLVFATGPGGVFILSPQGTQIGIIRTSKATANVAFDKAENYLYLTCTDRLLRVKLK